jgi:ABC-type transport system involved in multi-copper enzyme maturation permease subunit
MKELEMNELGNMLWIEWRKAVRSRMPLWTTLGSLFMPMGMALLIFISKHPEVSKRLGLISAKADLIAYAATDWPAYITLFGQIIAAGGFFFFVLAISWVFGREFADGTLKDMLAVPVGRGSILLAKFILTMIWSAVMSLFILLAGLAMGALIQLPGGSLETILHGSRLIAITTGLVIVAILPFGLIASIGRGYLLPLGLAVIIVMMANLVAVLGWGEYFPWAAPGLYAQGGYLPAVSYWVVILTGLLGMLATYWWWKYADQNR